MFGQLFINLPINNKQFMVKNVIINNQLTDPITLSDLIKRLEYELLDIVDLFIREGVRCSSDIPYYILGGKALNNIQSIANRTSISPSFNYDIHVANDCIAGEANRHGKLHYNHVHKNRIFQKLKGMNLVTDYQKNIYLMEDMFCYGICKTRDFLTNVLSVFFKLPLRDDLFLYNGVQLI